MNIQELELYCSEPKVDYYEQLILNKDLILQQKLILNQTELAKVLNMHQTKLSTVLQLLSALQRLDNVKAV